MEFIILVHIRYGKWYSPIFHITSLWCNRKRSDKMTNCLKISLLLVKPLKILFWFLFFCNLKLVDAICLHISSICFYEVQFSHLYNLTNFVKPNWSNQLHYWSKILKIYPQSSLDELKFIKINKLVFNFELFPANLWKMFVNFWCAW